MWNRDILIWCGCNVKLRSHCHFFLDNITVSLLHTKQYLLKILLICYRYLQQMPSFSVVIVLKGLVTQWLRGYQIYRNYLKLLCPNLVPSSMLGLLRLLFLMDLLPSIRTLYHLWINMESQGLTGQLDSRHLRQLSHSYLIALKRYEVFLPFLNATNSYLLLWL